MPSILIVCFANQCRSPMAEGILQKLVETRPDHDQWRVESAGICADLGSPATKHAQVIMACKGIDISSHFSQPVDKKLIKQFDLVLTMEKIHRDTLKHKFPEYSDRIFMISEMVGKVEDIADPIGGELEDYRVTADILEGIFSEGFDRINRIATSSQNA